MNKPSMINIEVCDTCNLSWEAHVERSEKRARDLKHHTQWILDYIPSELELSLIPVNLNDCIYLLQRVNEGPIGYTGPMGAPGRDCSGV